MIKSQSTRLVVLAMSQTAGSIPKVRRSSGGGNKKGTSAERRATHNAVERARRESLNVRFLELAANLPATSTVRRPSKSLIVNKSLAFVGQALSNETTYRLRLDELVREHRELLEEVNTFRLRENLEPRCSVIENPAFTTFPAPLADANYAHNRRASAAIAQGMSLGGDFGNDGGDDDLFDGDASVKGSPSPPQVRRYDNLGQSANVGFERQQQKSSTEERPAYEHVHRSSIHGVAHDDDRRDSYVSVYSSIFSEDQGPTHYQHLHQQDQQPSTSRIDTGHYIARTTPNVSYVSPPDPRYAFPPIPVPMTSSDHQSSNPIYAAAASSAPGGMDYFPPITPTTAAVFSNLMNNINVAPEPQRGAQQGARQLCDDENAANSNHYFPLNHPTQTTSTSGVSDLHGQAPYASVAANQDYLTA